MCPNEWNDSENVSRWMWWFRNLSEWMSEWMNESMNEWMKWFTKCFRLFDINHSYVKMHVMIHKYATMIGINDKCVNMNTMIQQCVGLNMMIHKMCHNECDNIQICQHEWMTE
jgi:hypothetical protein